METIGTSYVTSSCRDLCSSACYYTQQVLYASQYTIGFFQAA